MAAWGNKRKRSNASLWSFLFLLPLFVLPCSLFQSLSTTVIQRLWDTGCACGGQMGKERTWPRMWREQRRPEKPHSRAWIPGPNTRFRSKPTTPLDQDHGATLSIHALQNLVHTHTQNEFLWNILLDISVLTPRQAKLLSHDLPLPLTLAPFRAAGRANDWVALNSVCVCVCV